MSVGLVCGEEELSGGRNAFLGLGVVLAGMGSFDFAQGCALCCAQDDSVDGAGAKDTKLHEGR
jgi:hypothetical protein